MHAFKLSERKKVFSKIYSFHKVFAFLQITSFCYRYENVYGVGVGGGDSGECERHHKSASSLEARTTPNWFSKNGTQSESYLYRIVRVCFGSVTKSYGLRGCVNDRGGTEPT